MADRQPVVVMMMGVAGAGKTTVGGMLASELGWSFHDGDDLHSESSVHKMARGEPLTDDDRWPWLHRVRAVVKDSLDRGERAVVACSGLKEAYRRHVTLEDPFVAIVYLKGEFELIRARLLARTDHYFNVELLPDQFEALEEPNDALWIDVQPSPTDLVWSIRDRLKL